MIEDKRGGYIMHSVNMIPRILFLIFAFLAIVFLVRSYNIMTVETYSAEATIFANAVVYSPDIIAYYDEEINRAYPGIVDLTKFPPQTIDQAIYFGEENLEIAAKITLTVKIAGEADTPVSVIYNEDKFYQWYELAKTKYGQSGPGGKELREVTIPVLARTEAGDLRQATLFFEIVIPRS